MNIINKKLNQLTTRIKNLDLKYGNLHSILRAHHRGKRRKEYRFFNFFLNITNKKKNLKKDKIDKSVNKLEFVVNKFYMEDRDFFFSQFEFLKDFSKFYKPQDLQT